MADELFRIQGDAPAAPDLMFWSLIGHESLSRASRYELTVLSTRRTIPADEVLGHAFDVVIRFQDQKQGWHERHCAGHAVRFSRVRQVGRYHEYRIGLRSWFWLLTRRRNSRILQDKPVLDVLDAVFEDSPIKRFRKTRADQVIDAHKPHRYCVQFEESDHDFISRLLEEEGIYYWFDAHDAPGTMHLADTTSVAHEPLPVAESLEFQSVEFGEARYNQVSAWIAGRRLDTGRWAAADSNFKTIRRKLQVEIDAADSHELADFEEFEFPGDYFETDDADAAARRRGDEMLARRERHWAVTRWPDVAVGRTFKYRGDPDASRNGEYLIGSCTFVVVHPGYEGMGDATAALSAGAIFDEMLADGASDESIAGSLRDIVCATLLPTAGARGVRLFVVGALPRSLPYKPPRLTPRTRMPGPQSAIVVGPEGDEIHTDEFGRVKVHFHWDRYDESDAKSTCWIRVSQPWAGKEWGGYFIPRIGQEVIVDFLNGDPDRPIVIGRVYNDDQRIPFEQPTYSGFRTRSTPGGAPTNFNALRFRDDKGREQVFIHSERRMDVRVKKNKYETVQGTSNTLIGGGHILTTGGSGLDLHVKGATHGRDEADHQHSVGGAVGLIHEGATAGVFNTKLSLSAPEIVLEAKTRISMKVGGNCVVIDASGVTVAGAMVKINSGGYGADADDVDIEDPYDAAQADTGEPGYVDRLPPGGKGGGRKRRHAGAHHAHATPRPGESAQVTALRQKLAQTASGRHALEVYDRYGVETTFNPGQGSSYSGSKFNLNRQNLNPTNPGDWNEHTFVHEMNHAQADHEKTTLLGQATTTSKDDYRNAMINEEAEGMVRQAEYANEQKERGTPMSNPPPWQGSYDNAWRNGRDQAAAANPAATPEELDAAGRAAGKRAMENQLNAGSVTTSNSGETYPKYYERIWATDRKKAGVPST